MQLFDSLVESVSMLDVERATALYSPSVAIQVKPSQS